LFSIIWVLLRDGWYYGCYPCMVGQWWCIYTTLGWIPWLGVVGIPLRMVASPTWYLLLFHGTYPSDSNHSGNDSTWTDGQKSPWHIGCIEGETFRCTTCPIYIYMYVRFADIVVSSWQQSMYDSTILSRRTDTSDASRHNIYIYIYATIADNWSCKTTQSLNRHAPQMFPHFFFPWTWFVGMTQQCCNPVPTYHSVSDGYDHL
jgi:hypothetical protein